MLLRAVVRPEGTSGILRVLSFSVVVWIGMVSHGVYLWHLPILEWCLDRLDGRNWGLGGVLSVVTAFSLLVAAFSYKAVTSRL